MWKNYCFSAKFLWFVQNLKTEITELSTQDKFFD